MVEDFDKYMALAKVLNTTWGTGQEKKKESSLLLTTHSVKYQLRDDKKLKASVMMIVTVPNTPRLVMEMNQRFHNECLDILRGSLQSIAQDYKERNEGKSVKFKILEETVMSGTEYTTTAQYRPSKSGYFRLDALIEIE